MNLHTANTPPKLPITPPVVEAVAVATTAPTVSAPGAPEVLSADDQQARRGFMMARNRSAAHLYISVGMTAERNGIRAEVVKTAPTTLAFQLQVKAASEDCSIAPVHPRTVENGLELVGIHRPNKEGVKTHGENPENYQWYRKQNFQSQMVLKEDVDGVRFARPEPKNDVNGACLGGAEFRLTDFSGPPKPPKDAHIPQDLQSQINS
jgi:hypothetical protein